MTLYRDKVTITQVKRRHRRSGTVRSLTEAINAVWEKRHELVAVTKGKRAPRHLDIWELLRAPIAANVERHLSGFRQKGMLEEAIKEWQQAISIDKGNCEGHLSLACLHSAGQI